MTLPFKRRTKYLSKSYTTERFVSQNTNLIYTLYRKYDACYVARGHIYMYRANFGKNVDDENLLNNIVLRTKDQKKLCYVICKVEKELMQTITLPFKRRTKYLSKSCTTERFVGQNTNLIYVVWKI